MLTPSIGLLGDPVDHGRLGQAGGLEHGGRDVDHVVELRADLPAGGEADVASARSCRCGCRPSARRPASSTGTACPSRAPSRPRSGCTRSGCRTRRSAKPRTRRVSSAAAPLKMNVSLNEPLTVPSARRPIVADDVVDERVIEHAEVVEGVHQPADVMVGVLEEAGVDLHLAGQHRLELVGHVLPGGDLLVPLSQLGVRPGSRRAPSAGPGSPRAARPSRRRSGPCTCPTTRSARGAAHASRPGA